MGASAAGRSSAIDIVAGPNEYLFGEETGLLEVVDGRPPFPRVAPPYRHGAEEVGEGRISAAHVAMAVPCLAASAGVTPWASSVTSHAAAAVVFGIRWPVLVSAQA